MHSSRCQVEKRDESSHLENNANEGGCTSKLTLSPSLAWASFSHTTLFFLVRKLSFSRWVLSSSCSVCKRDGRDRSDRRLLLWPLATLTPLYDGMDFAHTESFSCNAKHRFTGVFNKLKVITLSFLQGSLAVVAWLLVFSSNPLFILRLLQDCLPGSERDLHVCHITHANTCRIQTEGISLASTLTEL